MKKCKMCNLEIRSEKKYCSNKCSNADPEWKAKMVASRIKNKSYVAWNKGIKWRESTRQKLSGENSPNWKGENITYSTLHKRICKYFEKPDKCENCGTPKIKKKITNLHWANVSGQYLFIKDDWVALCSKCHRKQENEIKQKRLHSHY